MVSRMLSENPVKTTTREKMLMVFNNFQKAQRELVRHRKQKGNETPNQVA